MNTSNANEDNAGIIVDTSSPTGKNDHQSLHVHKSVVRSSLHVHQSLVLSFCFMESEATNLGTGLSTILENDEPEDGTGWLHRNDTFVPQPRGPRPALTDSLPTFSEPGEHHLISIYLLVNRLINHCLLFCILTEHRALDTEDVFDRGLFEPENEDSDGDEHVMDGNDPCLNNENLLYDEDGILQQHGQGGMLTCIHVNFSILYVIS